MFALALRRSWRRPRNTRESFKNSALRIVAGDLGEKVSNDVADPFKDVFAVDRGAVLALDKSHQWMLHGLLPFVRSVRSPPSPMTTSPARRLPEEDEITMPASPDRTGVPMRRIAAVSAVVTMLAVGAFAPASASAKVSLCGSVLIVGKDPVGERTESGGYKIRATNVSCKRARSVVRECIRRGRVKGWTTGLTSETQPNGFEQTRVYMQRAKAKITYAPAGGGSCGF
jgi:hypothetical protein